MRFAHVKDGVATQLPQSGRFTIEDRLFDAGMFHVLSHGDLASIDIYPIIDSPGSPPEGHILVPTGNLNIVDNQIWLEYAPQPLDLPVPEAIDMRQARLKLIRTPHGEGTQLQAVEAFVATQSEEVQIEWQYAKELRRDHPLVATMALFFGYDTEGANQWFREASEIGPPVAVVA